MNCLGAGGKSEAREHFYALLRLRPADPNAHAYLACLLAAEGRLDEALEFIRDGQNRHPHMPLYREADFALRQRRARAHGLPSILLNTQFKSGSMFLSRRLAQATGLPLCYLTRTPLDNGIVPEWAELFARGGAIAQDHLAATIPTIARFKRAGIARMLVQVRDPRQSMISAIHHYAKLQGRESADAILMRARLPQSHESWDTERRIDHYIETELQAQIHWVEFWLEVARAGDPKLRILTSRFQDFAADRSRLFHDLMEFFAIPPASIDWPLLEKPPVAGELHFRAGRSEEWREILTPAQRRRAGAMMPAALERYFEADTVSPA